MVPEALLEKLEPMHVCTGREREREGEGERVERV